MKTIITIVAIGLSSLALEAGEKDVWYNAKGEVAKVTPVEKEKERFVPQWEKREQVLAANRAARSDGRVRHSGVQRYYDYRSPAYGWYSGGCGGYSPHYSGYYHRGYHRARWRFSGTYHGNGWSVRLNY